MAERRMGVIALLLCFCLCLMPVSALAASTTDAKEPISPDIPCQLTVCYGYDGVGFANAQVMLYRVASVSADFQYTLTPAFAGAELELNGISSQSQWNTILSTAQSYIAGAQLEADQTVTTDPAGNAVFQSLETGLYLVQQVFVEQEDMGYLFDATLIALPGLSNAGLWQYQVSAAAKPQQIPPEKPVEYKVLKLWKGDTGRNDRPQSIQVEIFRNQEAVETVTLSQENQWVYSWNAKDDGAIWTVVERNVPEGYTVTLTKKETTFVLTNTRPPDPSDPPKTGDTDNVMLYTVLMLVSGMMLVILAILGKRKNHEEN